ncbi:hypothetical protein CR513_15909, partial [Mucuna pruriens]
MVKGSILNKKMRRKAQGGEIRKREKKRAKVSPSPYTRMWNVITITKQGIYKSIVSCGKKRTKATRVSQKEKNHDDDDRVTIATGDDLVILQDFELVNFVSNESMWIIDSGATLHVAPRKKFFISYTSGDFGVLKMGNDGVTKVIGVGDVCLQTNIGVKLWLKGVKHAPDVVRMLNDGGLIITLVMENGNLPKVTWLWLEERKFLNCIGQKLWLLKIV